MSSSLIVKMSTCCVQDLHLLAKMLCMRGMDRLRTLWYWGAACDVIWCQAGLPASPARHKHLVQFIWFCRFSCPCTQATHPCSSCSCICTRHATRQAPKHARYTEPARAVCQPQSSCTQLPVHAATLCSCWSGTDACSRGYAIQCTGVPCWL